MTAPKQQAACRIFLVGEGPSDIGDLAHDPPYRCGREGFIQPILRRLVGDAARLSFDGRKVALLPRLDRRRRIPGHGERAARALELAVNDKAQVLVFVKDLDRTAGKRASATESRRKLAEMRREIEAGLAQVRSVDPDAADVTCITATPCRMTEAWALADGTAIAAVAGTATQTVKVPPRPEESWGDEHDPSSGHPKRVLQRALGRASVSAADFAAIAEHARTEVLEQRCPASFAPFARDVADALRACRDRGR